MSNKSLNFRIVGVSPLLMHNGQLADPLNSFAQAMKKVSGKRSKTDADYVELARLEWYGGLYVCNGAPCIPGEVLEASFVAAARKSKRGKQAQAGLMCPGNYPLEYVGPKELDQLWENPEFRLTVGVRISNSRVMRTRPRFQEWSSEIQVVFDDSVLNEREVNEIVKIAGEGVGLMDWRPKFGRFEIVE